MKREDVIRWMQEVGAKENNPTPKNYEGFVDIFQHFAALVADHEREACARVCDGVSKDPFTKVGGKHAPYMEATAKDCADTIRARGVPR
jgi:hypothetical protein